LMVVQAGIPHPASIQVNSVVEQRAITIGSGLQFLEKLPEERHVKRIDLGNLQELLRIVAVMTDRMMRIRNADFRIRAVIELASELERHDTRDVGLKRQDLQVEH